eukprot:6002165-Alexandrium_andersonii.AAC.1
MSASLVGSEMCIRDSSLPSLRRGHRALRGLPRAANAKIPDHTTSKGIACLLYTSDAADDM